MLVMSRWRQRITGARDHFDAAPLAFVDPAVRCRGSGLMGRIESLVGEIREVVTVFVLRHCSGDVSTPLGNLLSS